MDDKFDRLLRERLASLDAAVPVVEPAENPQDGFARVPVRRIRRGNTVGTARPLGLVVALSLLLVTVVVVATVVRAPQPVGIGSQSAATPAATTSPASTIVTGPNGIPTRINGQGVHTMLDQSAWPSTSEGFLLAAQPSINALSCPTGGNLASPPYTSVENHLLTGLCNYASLDPIGAADSVDQRGLAPKSPPFSDLFVWAVARAPLVVRVHTHDAEAALCTAARRAQCEGSVVVDAIIWPTIPTVFAGERVYRGNEISAAADAGTVASLPGSFLLGGVVWAESASVLACSPPSFAAQDELVANCVPTVTIDGAFVAPKSSFSPVVGEVVIVRGHVNDPLAAQCGLNVRSACAAALVVNTVVWSEGPYPLGPRLSSAEPDLTPASNEPTTPTSTGPPLGPSS